VASHRLGRLPVIFWSFTVFLMLLATCGSAVADFHVFFDDEAEKLENVVNVRPLNAGVSLSPYSVSGAKPDVMKVLLVFFRVLLVAVTGLAKAVDLTKLTLFTRFRPFGHCRWKKCRKWWNDVTAASDFMAMKLVSEVVLKPLQFIFGTVPCRVIWFVIRSCFGFTTRSLCLTIRVLFFLAKWFCFITFAMVKLFCLLLTVIAFYECLTELPSTVGIVVCMVLALAIVGEVAVSFWLCLTLCRVVAAQNDSATSPSHVLLIILQGTGLGLIAVAAGIILFSFAYIGVSVIPFWLRSVLEHRGWAPQPIVAEPLPAQVEPQQVEPAQAEPVGVPPIVEGTPMRPRGLPMPFDTPVEPAPAEPEMARAVPGATPQSKVKRALHEMDNTPEPKLDREGREQRQLEAKVRESLKQFCQAKMGTKTINFVKDVNGKVNGIYPFLNQLLGVLAASKSFHEDEKFPWNEVAHERTVIILKRLLAEPLARYLDEVTDFRKLNGALNHLISKTLKMETPESWYGILLEMKPEKDEAGQLSRFVDRFEQYCEMAQLFGGQYDKTLIDICLFLSRLHFKGFYTWFTERSMTASLAAVAATETWASFKDDVSQYEGQSSKKKDLWERRFEPRQPFVTDNALLRVVVEKFDGRSFFNGTSGKKSKTTEKKTEKKSKVSDEDVKEKSSEKARNGTKPFRLRPLFSVAADAAKKEYPSGTHDYCWDCLRPLITCRMGGKEDTKRLEPCSHPSHSKAWKRCAFGFIDHPEVLLENCRGGIQKYITELPESQRQCLKDFFNKHRDVWAKPEYKAAFGGPKNNGSPPPKNTEGGDQEEDFV
jgi:hypothetical protein